MSHTLEIITSSQNKYVSLARSLSDKKQRQKSHLYRFDGVKLLGEALIREVPVELVIYKESAYKTVKERVNELYSVDIFALALKEIVVCDSVFDKISEENSPEGVITLAKYDADKHKDKLRETFEDERVLLLESVRDPQNVGAILRCAAAFKVDRVVMSRDCADIYSSKTLRASMGAVFSMNIDRVDSMSDAIRAQRESGRRVFAAALDENALRLGSEGFSHRDCVVIGNEGHGLSDETIKACDASVYIPICDRVESLNAAVAASVLMWEFFGK